MLLVLSEVEGELFGFKIKITFLQMGPVKDYSLKEIARLVDSVYNCIMPKVKNFKVIIEQDEDGIFVADVPAIPGCYTQGKTYEEAVIGIKEVIELCLEEAKADPVYRAKINLEESSSDKFLGITSVPARISF